MLSTLSIRDFVLIDKLDLVFEDGLAALTGETGAGKSILLDALGLALGGRADAGAVRKGCDRRHHRRRLRSGRQPSRLSPCWPSKAWKRPKTARRLILRRQLGADGRSRAFANDQACSVGLLRQLGNLLVEIHGQFDTHGLFDAATHRGLLDQWAGLAKEAAATATSFAAWHAKRRKRSPPSKPRSKPRAARKNTLRHAARELEEADPKPGEERELVRTPRDFAGARKTRRCPCRSEGRA